MKSCNPSMLRSTLKLGTGVQGSLTFRTEPWSLPWHTPSESIRVQAPRLLCCDRDGTPGGAGVCGPIQMAAVLPAPPEVAGACGRSIPQSSQRAPLPPEVAASLTKAVTLSCAGHGFLVNSRHEKISPGFSPCLFSVLFCLFLNTKECILDMILIISYSSTASFSFV